MSWSVLRGAARSMPDPLESLQFVMALSQSLGADILSAPLRTVAAITVTVCDSELIRAARSDGPQIVTRHGEEIAVVMDIADYQHLRGGTAEFEDYLRSGQPLEQCLKPVDRPGRAVSPLVSRVWQTRCGARGRLQSAERVLPASHSGPRSCVVLAPPCPSKRTSGGWEEPWTKSF